MSLITAVLIITPLAAFSPFSLQQAPVNEGLPDSFKVSIIGANPTTPADSSTPQPSRESKATGQITESNSSGGAVEVCDKVSNTTGTSTSIHDSDQRPDDRILRLVQRTRGRCVEASLSGRIEFSADEREIASMGRGARARFRELLSGSSDREIVITSDGGQPRREYLVNGRNAEFDAEGKAWLASMIVKVLRESGYNAKERVVRLDQQGGVNRVLTEIDSIVSTGAKSTYYAALLERGRPIPDAAQARIFTRIKQDLAASSGDLRRVLQMVAPRTVRQAESRTAFADAIASIESDGDKSTLLTELVMTADRELLLDIAEVALSIGSDGDKARVLITAAARYLGNQDTRLRESFFRVAESVGSDGDKARVLISAAPYGHADEAVTEAAIRATLGMGSDGNKAYVLTYIASQKLLTTTKIKDAYLDAARSIGSDGDRARVLRAALPD